MVEGITLWGDDKPTKTIVLGREPLRLIKASEIRRPRSAETTDQRGWMSKF